MSLTEDRDGIIEVLQFTEKLFDLLINRLPNEDRKLFQDAWSETRPVLHQQIASLQSIETEQDSIWTAIKRVGLTGKNLAMKLHYLARAADEGWTKKLLNLLNKFLASLIAGLPGAEQIKELKEWLEDLIEDDSGSGSDIKQTYAAGSYKHFRKKP